MLKNKETYGVLWDTSVATRREPKQAAYFREVHGVEREENSING